MLKRRLLRVMAAVGLAVTVSLARPAPAAADDAPCGRLCMVKTTSSGYVGEEALFYFAGCYLGCTVASLGG